MIHPVINVTIYLTLSMYKENKPNTSPPVFLSSLPQIVIQAETSTTFKLPRVKDPDNDNWNMTVYYENSV